MDHIEKAHCDIRIWWDPLWGTAQPLSLPLSIENAIKPRAVKG